MSEGPEWVGCGLVLDSVGLGPRASPSAAVVQNGPQAEDAGGAHEKPRVAALPKEAWGFQSANYFCVSIYAGQDVRVGRE